MAGALRLKPWLAALALDEKRTLVLSETTTHTLTGELLLAMLPLLDGTRGEDDIVDELPGSRDPALVYYQLLQLRRKGLVEAVPGQERSPRDILRERMECDPARPASPARIIVTALDGLDPLPVAERLSGLEFCQVEAADWRGADLSGEAIWIVLTPDYLDPQLEAFSAKAQKACARWLPCKPDGVAPWFGPLVVPGRTACLECLLHRLRGHRSRDVAAARNQGALPRFSQGRSAASLDASCGLLGLELEKFVCGSPHRFLDKGVVSLDLKTLETRRHELVRRPHCPVCGQAGPVELRGLPEEDFVLSSQPKADYSDGGERIQAAAETMARLESRISPITGEVGELSVRRDVPSFLGSAVASSWATLDGHKDDSGAGRLAAVGTSAGKGRSEIQARVSAVGEALERYCSQHFGYEPCLRAAYADISGDAIHPLALNPFTDSQFDNREEWAKRAPTGHVPQRFDETASIDWTPAWSLTGRRWKHVPSAHVYYQYPKEAGGRFVHGDSNGVAAGNCVEEAIVQGFMELVERDGVGLWWYNMVRPPCLDLATFGSALALDAMEGLRRRSRSLHVLNLTTDLGIPVFAAVALHDSDTDAESYLGFGAHFDPRIALDRALSEMGQSMVFVERESPNELCRKVTGRPLSAEAFLRPGEGAPKIAASAFARHATGDFLTDIERCVSILDALGIELLVADLTRPEVGLSVVRVMAPGLVHFWPRLGARRLYEVPVKLGLLDAPRAEADLYPVPFFY